MNKKFSSDFYMYADKASMENVMKFYQSTVNIFPQKHEIQGEQKNINPSENYWDICESIIQKIQFNQLNKKSILLLQNIKKTLEKQKNIYFLPVVTIKGMKYINNINDGIYIFDFINDSINKYKQYDRDIFMQQEGEKELDFNICISYFLDRSMSVSLDREKGFIKGIFQIGQFYEKILEQLHYYDCDIYSKDITEQIFTHKLGINAFEQLFIKNQFIKFRGEI